MRLSPQLKLFIVRELACFSTPTEVQAALVSEFGLEQDAVKLNQILLYDPTKAAGASLSKPLRKAFEETREAYLAELMLIPAAHRAYRVRRLAAMAQKAEERRNYPLAKDCYRQIAEEMGGKFTNKLEIANDLAGIAKLLGMSRDELTAALGGGA